MYLAGQQQTQIQTQIHSCEVCDSGWVDRRVQMIYICLVSTGGANKSSAARPAPSPAPAWTSRGPTGPEKEPFRLCFASTQPHFEPHRTHLLESFNGTFWDSHFAPSWLASCEREFSGHFQTFCCRPSNCPCYQFRQNPANKKHKRSGNLLVTQCHTSFDDIHSWGLNPPLKA